MQLRVFFASRSLAKFTSSLHFSLKLILTYAMLAMCCSLLVDAGGYPRGANRAARRLHP
jgi:hypothetical protein